MLYFRTTLLKDKHYIMEFTGKIIAVLEPRSGVAKSTGNPWMVQEYVIENHDQYPRKMCFEVFGEDKIKQFDIKLGEEMVVSFDIDARQWKDRWFNSIRCWRVERTAPQQPMAGGAPVPPPAFPGQQAPQQAPQQQNPADDLPF